MVAFKKNNWEKREIIIKDLSLWDENARFPEEFFNKKESELIEYFLKKKEFKMLDFAKEVVNEFDLPQLERIVVLYLNRKYIVIEGNRRLVVYKLLIDPMLTEDPQIKKAFFELKKNIKIGEDFKLEANITSIKEEGLRFIDRKHNKGNNEVAWGEPERRNFSIRRSYGNSKDVRRIELTNAVKKLEFPTEIKNAILGKGYVTTFYRIIDSISAQKKLGYKVLSNGQIKIRKENSFNDLLKIISFDIWKKISFDGTRINSRSLNKKEAIDSYIKNLDPKDIIKVNHEISTHNKENLFGERIFTKSSNRSKPLSALRDCLITPTMYINDIRINDIYDELRRKLIVDNVPNAVAVLFRVFLECSVDSYIEKNKIIIKKDIKLAGKIQKVADDLRQKGLANDSELKSIRKVATKDNNSILSVSTFHDFVHDYKTSPIASELKKHWDNLNDFFIILWKSFSYRKN